MNAPPNVVIEKTLEFDERIKPSVITGCKTFTIRKGHRYFARNITIAKYPAIVNDFRHYTLVTVPLKILVDEGFKNIFDVLHKLRKYYPDITLQTPVTVIEFRMDVVDGGSTHKNVI